MTSDNQGGGVWYESWPQRKERVSKEYLISLGAEQQRPLTYHFPQQRSGSSFYLQHVNVDWHLYYAGSWLVTIENKGHLIDVLNALRIKQPRQAQATQPTAQVSTGSLALALEAADGQELTPA